MEAACPATTPDGVLRSASCAKPIAARQTKPARTSTFRSSLRHTSGGDLRPLQTVLVDDDMKVLDLPCQGFWDLYRERLSLLRKQSALHISIGDPHHLALVVVKAGDDVLDGHRLATLIQQFSAQYVSAFR